MAESENLRRSLCIFARAPELGRVKRRLAVGLGQQAALAAHIELLEGTLSRCAGSTDYRTELWITGGHQGDGMLARWQERYQFSLHRQQGLDLGQRMWFALAQSLGADITPLLIGSDCPDIDERYLSAAYDGLQHADLVLGPAEDGGYGLIGLRCPGAGIFEGIPWGSPGVLGATLERADQLALSVVLLDEIYDVDLPEDWRRYQSSGLLGESGK